MITIYYVEEKYKISKNHPSDSAFDLNAKTKGKTITILPGKRARIDTGIRLTLPPYWEANIRPRSGIALRYGVTVLNTPGTIDQGYNGEISVILINHGDETFTIRDGDRIAQLTFHKIPKYTIEQLLIKNTQLIQNDSSRGEKSLGSSGTKNFLSK